MPQCATGGTDRTWVHGFLSGAWAYGERCRVGDFIEMAQGRQGVFSWTVKIQEKPIKLPQRACGGIVLPVVWRKGSSVGKGTCYQPAPVCSVPGTHLVAEESTPIAQLSFHVSTHVYPPPHTHINEWVQFKTVETFLCRPKRYRCVDWRI